MRFPPSLLGVVASTATLLIASACGSEPTPTQGPPDAPTSAPPISATVAGPAPAGEIVPLRMRVSPHQPQPEPWMVAVRAAQLATADSIAARHDFTFRDVQPGSGITFQHRSTPDSASDSKPNHYDHGNGIAAADVDGDGLIDIYFVSQIGPNSLWRNLGDGTFEDITAEAGVAMGNAVGVTAAFGDLDNDGDQDLYVTTVRGGNVLFANDGAGRFTDVTASSGLGYAGHSSAPVLFDYNQDGLLDVFLAVVGRYTTSEVGNAPLDAFRPDGTEFPYFIGADDAFTRHLDPASTETSILFENQGGLRFTDVTTQVGLTDDSWSGDATPIDVNGDGWLDLYILNMQGHDQYFENQEGRFVRRTLDVFPNTPWGSMGVKVFDFDNDELLDLYVTDMHSDMSENITPDRDKAKARMRAPEEATRSEGRSIWGNAFYRNTGGGSFSEISDAIGAETYWPWGISVADVNADGYQDVFVAASMNSSYRYGPNSMLLNDGGLGFRDAEWILGLEPRRDGEAFQPWFSVDCTAEPNHMVCADAGVEGRVDLWEAKGSRSSVIFDIDNDGDLDIVTSEWNNVPQVLESDLAQTGQVNYFQVSLVGSPSNRNGLGSVVTVHAGDLVGTQVMDGKSGYLSQSVLPLYFGLGPHTAADRVTVRWPSGTEQTIEGPIASGTLLEIIEASGPSDP